MLSVVVVRADGKRVPGENLFTLARELGKLAGRDKDAFLVEELKRVNEAWRDR